MNNNDEQILLSSLGIFKIKYKVLSELDIAKVDAFHIDMNTILNVLHANKHILKYHGDYMYTIASSLINLAAHFRQFFVRNGWDVPIYFYFDDDRFSLKDDENNNVTNAIRLISVIVKYIPNVYLITNQSNKSVKIPVAIKYFSNKYDKNLLLTRDTIYYQLLDKSFKILRPIRDETYIVKQKNMYQHMGDNDKEYTISPELCSAILSYCGTKDFKGIPHMGIKKTLKMFQKAVDDGSIVNQYYADISDLLSDMSIDKIDINIVLRNFKKIDIRRNFKKISKSDEIIFEEFIIDKFAKKDLIAINTKYFTGFNTLMLHELLLEPEHSNDKKKNKIEW